MNWKNPIFSLTSDTNEDDGDYNDGSAVIATTSACRVKEEAEW
jgi:hypothetical protein